jgi:Flp pilus assembly protein TadD
MRQYNHFMKLRAYAQAARAVEAAVRNDPTNPLVRLYLAASYEKMRDWRRAIGVYRGALEAGIATEHLLSRLGKAYLRVRDLENGVRTLEEASRINPTDLDNFQNLGVAYLELGRVGDAERAFKAIVIQDEHYAAAYNGLGLAAVQRGSGDAARADFEKALALDPEQYEAMLNLGVLYQKSGQKELALRYLQMFLEKAPREEYSHLLPEVRVAIQELRART